jgi:competence protein ComFC
LGQPRNHAALSSGLIVPAVSKLVAVVETNPRTLRGPWASGFALDWHTLSSTPIGHNQFGHMMFDTKRPPVGQLLYELKYGRTQTAAQKQEIAEQLADTAAHFVQNAWRLAIDAIVPVPPSNARTLQPVFVVAEALAARLGVAVCTSCLTKVKQTPQLKDITDYDKRAEALKDAFTVTPELTAGKALLLFDDLHGSGATVGHIVEVLKNPGRAKAVYLLTLTTK